MKVTVLQNLQLLGSGCGSVGRVVTSYTRGPRFESSHRQKFIEHLFTVNYIEKTYKRKRGREWPIFLKKKPTIVSYQQNQTI